MAQKTQQQQQRETLCIFVCSQVPPRVAEGETTQGDGGWGLQKEKRNITLAPVTLSSKLTPYTAHSMLAQLLLALVAAYVANAPGEEGGR